MSQRRGKGVVTKADSAIGIGETCHSVEKGVEVRAVDSRFGGSESNARMWHILTELPRTRHRRLYAKPDLFILTPATNLQGLCCIAPPLSRENKDAVYDATHVKMLPILS